MSFYHVTNRLVIVELEAINKVKTEQRLAIKKIMKGLAVEKWYADDHGIHAIKVDNPKDWDRKIWCYYDKTGYGTSVLRPRASVNAAKSMRELFDSVPKVHEESLNDALNFSILFDKKSTRCGHKTLLGVTHIKVKDKWILYVPDWAVGQLNFPEGIKEITRTRFEEWGGSVSE